MDYEQAISQMWTLADKPERLRCFSKIVHEIGVPSGKEFWSQFWSIWTSSENLNEDREFIEDLITFAEENNLGSSLAGLDAEERGALAQMDNTLVVYRGCYEENMDGWSWTTDRNRAEFFANRASGEGTRYILRSHIPKASVLAHLMGRAESEIVIDPIGIDYDVDAEWEAQDPHGSALFYAVQNGSFFANNPELDQARAEMMLSTVTDYEAMLSQINSALAFAQWANLSSKLGYFQALKEGLEKRITC